MNIAMRAKTEQDAYITALMYYQKRLLVVEKSHLELTEKVEVFVGQFTDED